MNKSQVDALIRQWLREGLDQDRIQRLKPEFAKDFADHNGLSAHAAAAYLLGTDAEGELERWQRAVRESDWEQASPYVNSLITRQRLDISQDSIEYKMLCQGITLAAAELHGIRASRSLGDWSDEATRGTFLTPGVSIAAPALNIDKRSPTLGELVDPYLSERGLIDAGNPKRAMMIEAALTLFKRWRGANVQVHTIDKKQIGEFRSLLIALPPNHTKRFPGMTLEEIKAIADERGLKRLDPSTINLKYLSPISSFFDWCESGGHIEANPAKDVRVAISKTRIAGVKRGTFKTSHLQAMFQAPLYTGCLTHERVYEAGTTSVRDHRFWLPLLALWTGARLNELCQLSVADVREIEGCACLDINANDGKRLKTETAKRIIPLHPELRHLGLIDYVEKCREAKHSRLWPELTKGTTGYDSDKVSKWFARFLGFTFGDEMVAAQKLSFHSFRHTFKDAMRDAGLEERVQDALLGHASKHVSGSYGEGYKPRRLLEEISKVRYPGFDLSHLHESG